MPKAWVACKSDLCTAYKGREREGAGGDREIESRRHEGGGEHGALRGREDDCETGIAHGGG